MHARFEGNKSFSGQAEGGVDRSGLGEELMEAEREDGIAFAGFYEVEIDFADPEEKRFQVFGARFLGFSAIDFEALGDFRELKGCATFQSAASIMIDAEGDFALQPKCRGESLQGFHSGRCGDRMPDRF